MSGRDFTPRTEWVPGRPTKGSGWEAGEHSSLAHLGWMIAEIDKLLPPSFITWKDGQQCHNQLTIPPRERARLERGGDPEEQGEASQGDNTQGWRRGPASQP